jgi:predicted transcriptional regulator YheO
MQSSPPADHTDHADSAETSDRVLERYVEIAQMLSEMFGPVLETVVHDLRTPDQSIIAIFNEHITDREIGDPATDLGAS